MTMCDFFGWSFIVCLGIASIYFACVMIHSFLEAIHEGDYKHAIFTAFVAYFLVSFIAFGFCSHSHEHATKNPAPPVHSHE